ncbi:MAG: alkaline phosphatase family protein [Dehalococcoidia bacterium]
MSNRYIANQLMKSSGRVEMKDSRIDRVIVLGIDGLDPNILETLMDSEDLPAFSTIRETGTYSRLATINPPQSPVVWSTIATGSNPGYHGIFDFIDRNPANYLPVHSIVKPNPKNILARRSSMFLPVRKGTPFWAITSQANIPTTVIRWPITFPPEKIHGHMLSGLGVLDLRGSAGRYTFYMEDSAPGNSDMKGDLIPVSSDGEEFKTIIPGPHNSRIPLEICVADQDSSATVTIDGKSYTIRQGEWSDLIQLRFRLAPLRHVSGICRFYLDSIKPQLKLYLSSLQADPEKPAFLISHPDGYATELARDIGSYSTLGIPEDTNALSDGCLNDEAFLSLCDKVMEEREKMLWHELEHFKEGLLAFVFDTTDRIQHVYWGTTDPGHPAYNEDRANKYGNVIEDYYRRMDRILQRVLESVDQNTVICIVSDHGFGPFKRVVHINSWLVQNGLMVLRKPAQVNQGDPLFKNVVWEKTKAYALGFSSVFLNLRGREGKGVVNPGHEAEQLKEKIANILTSLRDPKTGRSVIRNVYTREDLYSGPYASQAPDLTIGFEPDYRASWQTAIGGAPPTIMEDNLKKWAGDHMSDAPCIPGVFLINRKITTRSPRVTDIAPTILSCFQIPKPESMEGDSLLSQP